MKTIINKIKSEKKLTILVLVLGVFAGLVVGKAIHTSKPSKSEFSNSSETISDHQQWTCSMHPQIKQNKPGLCPICAMDLVLLESSSTNDEYVDPNEIQMTASALALASIQTTLVQFAIPERKVQLLGKIKADERKIAELTARYGGRIEKLFINYTGQQVQKGEKLGTIYSPDLISAQQELPESLKLKESNPSFYKASRTKLRLWDITEQQIDAIEKKGEPTTYFDIVSPISGTVTKRNIAIGDYVNKGSTLFKVIDLSKVWIMFDAYESDLPWIRTGDVVDFTISSFPGEVFTGNVSYIEPFIDPDKRVAQVRVELNNTNQKLKPEMFVNGILTSNIAENTHELLIPKSAVLWTGKRAVVYVKVEDRKTTSFVYRQITLGPEAGDFYVVAEGLSEGEEIATNGVFKIDAAAQLVGKSSMMNPPGDNRLAPTDHHGEMIRNGSDGNALQTKIFHVSGNCEMCKSTIETSAKSLPGVHVANWDIETKKLSVTFNPKESSLSDIHETIAKSGYDTELKKASKDTYDNLPECCQYTRSSAKTSAPIIRHETFEVSGNCEMCEETIEASVNKLSGVKGADWSQESNMIEVSFHPDSIQLIDIHKAIAGVGYDTEREKADEEVYKNLPECCQYTRK